MNDSQPALTPESAGNNREIAKPKSRFSRLVPGLCAGACFVAWALILGWQLGLSGPDYRTAPLEFWDSENTTLGGHAFRSWALPFDRVTPTPEGWQHSIELTPPIQSGQTGWRADGGYLPDPAIDWERVRSIGFYLEPAGGRIPHGREKLIPIVSASLRDETQNLQFMLASPQSVQRGTLLELMRGSDGTAQLLERPHSLNLLITTRTPCPDLRLRVFLTSDPGTETYISYGCLMKRWSPVQTDAGSGLKALAWPFGRLTYPNPVPPMKRLDLIAGWWHLSPGLQGLAGLVLLAGIGIAVGTWLILAGGQASPSVGAAIMFAALGFGYAVFTPPLAAVDERRHIFSLLREVDAVDRLPEYVQLGLRCHSGRLIYRPGQKFSSSDLLQPAEYFAQTSLYTPESINTFVPLAADRSPISSRLWGLQRGAARLLNPAHMVLWLRINNLLLVSAAVGFAAGLWFQLKLQGPAQGLIGLAYVAIVPLAYFGMIISNYPVLVASSCLLTSWVTVMLWKPEQAAKPWLAVCGGLAAGLAFHSSRTAVILLLSLMIWWLHRIVAGLLVPAPPDRTAPRRLIHENLRLYGGLLLGFGATRLLSTAGYDTAIAKYVPEKLLPDALSSGWVLNIGLIAVLSIGFAVEFGVRRLGSSLPAQIVRLAAASLHATARIVAVAWVAMLVITLFLKVPNTPDIEYYSVYPAIVTTDMQLPPAETAYSWPKPLEPAQNAAVAIPSFLLSFGLGEHDHFTSRLFWSGFGFFDTMLPDGLISLCCAVFSTGLVLLLWDSSRKPAQAASILTLLIATFTGVGLLAYACARPTDLRNLIGRYLVSQYILLLVPAFSGWLVVLRRWPHLTATGAFLATGLHLTCITAIIGRYF